MSINLNHDLSLLKFDYLSIEPNKENSTLAVSPRFDSLVDPTSPASAESFFKAAKAGDIDRVKFFLDRGIPINTTNGYVGRTALYFACISGHILLAEYLLKNGASIAIGDYPTLLHLIARAESHKIADAVIPLQVLKHLIRLLPIDREERDRHITVLIAVLSGEICGVEWKSNARSKCFLESSLEMIRPLVKSKPVVLDFNRLEYLLYALLGKKMELEKAISSVDKQERLAHLSYCIKHVSWHKDEPFKKFIEEQLESVALTVKDSCEEKKSIKELYRSVNVARLYNSPSFLPLSPRKAKSISVREITEKKELIKLALVAKRWQRKIEKAVIIGAVPAAKISDSKQCKLVDSKGVINGIVEDLGNAVRGELTSEAHIYVALDSKKQAQGLAIAIDNLEEAHVQLDALAINPDNLGVIKKPILSGAGTALVKRVVEDTLSKKVSRVILESTESAYGWYTTKLGFRTIEEDVLYGDETVLQLDAEGMNALLRAK